MSEAQTLSLRTAEDRDAQDLFGLLTLCFADFPGCYVDPHDDLKDLLKPGAARKNDGLLWVTEDESGRVCACACVDFPEAATAELHRLYVRPDQQGRGLGSSLVRAVERHAREKGATRMVLWSDTRFTDAHRLYRKLGYTQTDRLRDLGDISNSSEYFFEKTL
ncbi:GNAT family N-acetyltransferase [Microvirga guangxiensis]|uniref:Putative acetyltransferase n=1 Tax=Microvirga guangxiensis TaxID=549386 RepID=A0A1G5B6F7_9HYPH|nr:GNAT family N-acetyltransferase [Microvirga guangxiensis]SCX85738.1 putative acetyltransferase [Microvirga guangxiensis]